MNRSSLTAFLSLLTLLLAFSVLTGAASAIWKPDPKDTKPEPPGARRSSGDERDLVAIEEDGFEMEGDFENGTLRGQVTDARTDDPVKGVAVQVLDGRSPRPRGRRGLVVMETSPSPGQTTTDVNGRYTVKVPPSKTGTLVSFQKAKYESSFQTVGFHGETTLDVSLTRNSFLIGTVTDSQGTSVKKVKVRAVKSGFLGFHDSTVNASHSGEGPFELDLRPGVWEVTVRSEGLRSKPVKVSIGKEDVRLDFVLEPDEPTPAPTSK